MPAVRGSDTLAATTVTLAPRRLAASASANPIRPEERLPMKRTASIGSRVPPALTSTFTPRSEAPPASTPSTASSSAGGSGSRPTPNSPGEPSGPTPGSSTATPRARKTPRLAWVAGCSYIALFMAGATISGRRQANAAAVSRLSARPEASFASVSAVAGATRYTSARSTSARCESGACSGSGSPGNTPRNGSGSHSVTSTGAPVIPAKEAVPTNRVDASVCTTRTLCPAFSASRVNSRAL